jgi:hypothetical protein
MSLLGIHTLAVDSFAIFAVWMAFVTLNFTPTASQTVPLVSIKLMSLEGSAMRGTSIYFHTT